jgi:hypothetical protein
MSQAGKAVSYTTGSELGENNDMQQQQLSKMLMRYITRELLVF